MTNKNTLTNPPAEAPLVRTRLSIMMFLQYAIWGAWLPLAESFLDKHRGISPDDVGLIMAVGAVGAIFAPFIAGQVADRYMSTERFLGITHLLGAVVVWQLAEATSFWLLLVLAIAYSLLYAPTMPLTNALAFHHLPDRDRQFGRVRLWGTIGWIAVGIGMGQWLLHHHTPAGLSPGDPALEAAHAAGKGDAFRLSAMLGAIMGIYCFTLPHTPPRPGKQKFAPLEAFSEIRFQPLLTLFLLSVPVSILHQCQMMYAGGFLEQIPIPKGSALESFNKFVQSIFGVGGGGLMTIGQISEVFCLAAVPFFAKRFSKKSILAFGLVCYALRFAVFTYLPSLEYLVPALALHGPIFACFIFLAFMIVDEECTSDVRASAQGLYNLVIVGFGIVLGSSVWGFVAKSVTDPATKKKDYPSLFGVGLWASLACLVLLLLFYPGDRRSSDRAAQRA